MTDQHLSSQYENELHVVSAQLIELGQRVDKQIFQAIDALAHANAEGARQVLAAELQSTRLKLRSIMKSPASLPDGNLRRVICAC